MKKGIFSFIFLASTLYAHQLPNRFLGQSAAGIWNTIHGNITGFFKPKEEADSFPAPEIIEPLNELSPFQKLFRESITFTNKVSNTLTQLAEQIALQTEQKLLTIDQAADYFIQEIEQSSSAIMKKILKETVDFNLDALMPLFARIKKQMRTLRHTIPQLEHAPVITQVYNLAHTLHEVQHAATALQQAGIAQMSAHLAAYAISSKEHPLVTQFHTLNNAYPTIITSLNELEIPKAGHIAHRLFNTTSELIEQIVLMHDSAGKIGSVLVNDALVHPLDSLKNQVRKLGNAAEFTTSTQPFIVAAPPTTTDALLEILKTCIWKGSFDIKMVAQEKIAEIQALTPKIKTQMTLLKRRTNNFKTTIAEFQNRLHSLFVAQLKEAPLFNIPIAPKILLDILEQEIEIVKSQLVMLMHASLALTYRMSRVIGTGAVFLDCINQTMGATDEYPFIHPDIIRGVGFISEDIVGFSSIIINITEALKEYNPLPFRDELDLAECI